MLDFCNFLGPARGYPRKHPFSSLFDVSFPVQANGMDGMEAQRDQKAGKTGWNPGYGLELAT